MYENYTVENLEEFREKISSCPNIKEELKRWTLREIDLILNEKKSERISMEEQQRV
jgi:hypothetical protein